MRLLTNTWLTAEKCGTRHTEKIAFCYWINKVNACFVILSHSIDTYASKTTNYCNFWTFRLVIQVIKQLLKIRQKHFCPVVHFVGFWKDGLLAELKARMSWGGRFLLFLKQRCLVTLRKLNNLCTIGSPFKRRNCAKGAKLFGENFLSEITIRTLLITERHAVSHHSHLA